MQAEKCVYGPDPLLDELCPDLMNVSSYSSIPHLKTMRLSDVRARVIDEETVRNLAQSCPVGEWCLPDDMLKINERRNSSQIDLRNSSLAFLVDNKLFCLIESCFESIRFYVDKCVENDLTNHIVQLAPQFCNFNIENTQNDYCVESSLRLIHVSAAFYMLSEEVKGPSPDVNIFPIYSIKVYSSLLTT